MPRGGPRKTPKVRPKALERADYMDALARLHAHCAQERLVFPVVMRALIEQYLAREEANPNRSPGR